MDFLAFEFELNDPSDGAEPGAGLEQGPLADFRIFAGGEIIYRDSDFPIVSLVDALSEWLARVETTQEAFVFDGATRGGSGTINAVLPALFRIMKGSQGWGLTSIQLDLASSAIFTLDQVIGAVTQLIAHVHAVLEASAPSPSDP